MAAGRWRNNGTASKNAADTEPEISAWEEARRRGVDMELLEETMRMTPEERFANHRRALQLALALAPEEEGD